MNIKGPSHPDEQGDETPFIDRFSHNLYRLMRFLLLSAFWLSLVSGTITIASNATHFDFQSSNYTLFPNGTAVLFDPIRDLNLTKRYNFLTGGMGVAGYLASTGYEHVGQVFNECRGTGALGFCTNTNCFREIMRFSAGNIFFFGAGVLTENIWTTLVSGESATIRKGSDTDDKQKRFARRRDDQLPALSEFGYNLPKHFQDIYDGVANGTLSYDEVFGQGQSPLDPHKTKRYACDGSSYSIRNNNEWWDFAKDSYGVKLQCKRSCAMNEVNWDALYELCDDLAYNVISGGWLSTQLTFYNTATKRTLLRCSLVIEETGSDTCPEWINGRGCQF